MSAVWEKKKIGEICRTGAGGTPLKSKPEYYENGEIPWLQSGEVASRDIRKTRKTITKLGLENSSAKVFPVNTVLVAMYGATAGQVGILRSEAATNQAVCGIFPNDRVTPEYLYYALLQKQSDLVATAAGNAQPNISQTKIKNTTIPVATLPEQKRIVATLDEAFAGIGTAIANTEKNLANARELFERYLDSVFSQRGEGWAEKPLKDVCEFSSGGTPSKKNSSYWDGEIPWVSGRDMKSTQLFDSKLHVSKAAVDGSATRLAAKGSLLVLVRGMGLAHGAQIAELMAPCTFNQDIKEIRPNPDLMPRYLVFMLRHQINSSSNVLSSAAHGTLKISTEAMKALRIFIPPHEQQAQIIAKIDALKEDTERLEAIYQQKLTALAELKQSLLRKAFSGELTADKVLPITSAKTWSATPATTSPAFAAHIMAVAYHWHESRGKNKTFGRVKAQKTLHLLEALAQIDLGRVPVKDAAGPNDFAHMRMAETWARENDFYQFVQRAEGPRGYNFVKGKRYNEWLSQALDALEPYKSTLNRVVSLLMPLDTQKAELVATAYAAWNNLLLDGHKPTEADIVHEARDNWHRDKQQYTESQFREAIARLRDHGMVPTGTGKRVTGQESLGL